jgi:hypothetical protein
LTTTNVVIRPQYALILEGVVTSQKATIYLTKADNQGRYTRIGPPEAKVPALGILGICNQMKL